MTHTRRIFIHSAALAAGISTAVGPAAQAQPPQGATPGPGSASNLPAGPPPTSASRIQVPTMKFAGAEISRLIAGCNPFYGFGHFNSILATVMREYYTAERVCDVLHQCNRFGINTHNFVAYGRAVQDIERFYSEGGKMHLVVQCQGDPADLVKRLKPLAIYYHGENTDRAFQNGQMASVKEWCKKVRDLGVTVGVGTHKPEVIAQVEHEAWDVDFYAGCVYNRTRTPDEWRKVLNNELVEMQGEVYLKSDPPRMYSVMRQTSKPCFAFKIMAAGRIDDRGADQAFQTAFESIKPIDGVFIGLFPRMKDEVRENAERVHRILAKG